MKIVSLCVINFLFLAHLSDYIQARRCALIFFDFKFGKAKIAKPTVLELLALVAICAFLAFVFIATR